MNKIFWDFVKIVVKTNNLYCKPCHYYESNKYQVNLAFKKYKDELNRKEVKHKKRYLDMR